MQFIGIIWHPKWRNFFPNEPFSAATLGSNDGGKCFESVNGEHRQFATFAEAKNWLDSKNCIKITEVK